MNQKATSKPVEEAIVENVTEIVKKPNIALVGFKKGAVAAKQAVTKIATAPSKLYDKVVYGACYGISYGAVFSSMMVVKVLPTNSPVRKGFHDGSMVARKDFKAHEQKNLVRENSTVVD